VSTNAARIMSLEEATAIGYAPLDDASVYAEETLESPSTDDAIARDVIGGPFAAPDFDEHPDEAITK
jgi:hypothetical protein